MRVPTHLHEELSDLLPTLDYANWFPNTENSVSETLDFQSSLLTEKIATHKSPLYYVFSLQVTYLLSISDYENVFDVELSSLLLL